MPGKPSDEVTIFFGDDGTQIRFASIRFDRL